MTRTRRSVPSDVVRALAHVDVRRVQRASARRPVSAGPALMVFAASLSLLVALSHSVRADSPENLRSQVTDLEQQASTLNIRYQTQAATMDQIAEHRLVDAQVLYTLKDYTRAAIILLDFVAKYKSSRGYPEAVFFLADSLYHKHDYLSAKRYFQQIANEVKGKYYQEALQRMVELSLRTGDYSDVQQYLTALTNIPADQLKPSVAYVKGKYYYFRHELDQALNTFRSIREDNKYYLHANYFIGATLVQKKDLGEAAKVFQKIVKVAPKNEGEQHIRDLSYLAIGRLLYEQGKINESIDVYQKISRRSAEFDTALYEIAWSYIKAKQYQRALRALDLMVLAQPESPFIPRVRVLQGNLLIRLKEWGRATDLFTETREKFTPIHNRMQQLMKEHADPNVFFDVLLARNMGKLTATVEVPQLAATWVKEDPKVKRAMHLVQDVRSITASIEEAHDLIGRLARAINSPAKIKIFPEFAAAKASSLEVENRLLLVRRAILAGEAQLVQGVASKSERERIEALAAERAHLEQSVNNLPKTATGYDSRTKTSLTRLELLDKRLAELATMVQALSAQLVAAQKYFADTAVSREAKVRDSFRKQSEAIKVMIVGLQAEVDEIRNALDDAKNSVGVGGAEEVAERSIKDQYRDVLAKEHGLLTQVRQRLSGGAGAEFDALASVFTRCDRIDTILTDFDKKLDMGVEQKLTGIRTVIAEEKNQVGRYQVEASAYKISTDSVAGGITYEGFQEVTKRFYEIVVRADVGIIDVAWALKDAKSKEVSRLVRQQKMDLQVLDSEFKEVLRDD